MDRLVYVAMSGAKESLRALTANNHNLANVSTTGFRADLSAFQTNQVTGAGLPSRAYAMNSSAGWDASAGPLQNTGRSLDVAVKGNGWIAVQSADGSEAYTRAGDLHVDENGSLVTATGLQVLSDSGAVTVSPYNSITIGADGTISIVPAGQTASTSAVVGRIKLVNPATQDLVRGQDGLFRRASGEAAPSDAAVSLVPGALEGSNVDVASVMTNMIELSRRYELQIKAMRTAEDTANSGTKLLQTSS
jgi:flagellar basal-body rod protein FlgF